MRVSNRTLAQAVLACIEDGQKLADVANGLAAYLVSERRTKDAEAIVREVERLLALNGHVEINITTAKALDDSLKSSISSLFGTSKQAYINETIDPSVLGGVLVESGERRLDLTVRRQIQRLKGVRV